MPLRHVYYLTRPDFLKHHHIHKRKVEALREAGLSATLIAFVPEEIYRSREKEYEGVARERTRLRQPAQIIRMREMSPPNVFIAGLMASMNHHRTSLRPNFEPSMSASWHITRRS